VASTGSSGARTVPPSLGGQRRGLGPSAVDLVERRVEVQVPLVPIRRDWPGLLGELAQQLNEGGYATVTYQP
jgi:hypothetical protein